MYSNEADDVDFLRSDIPWVVCTVNLLFHERAILKLGCIMNKLKVCCSVAFNNTKYINAAFLGAEC